MGPLCRILILCNALVLALPPGWCCAALLWGRCKQGESAPTSSDCCCCPKTKPDHSSPVPIPAPSSPAKLCCCQSDPLAPPTSKPVLEASVLVSWHGNTETLMPADVEGPSAGGRSCILLPPLRIVHCVWRC
jgi:hypothetical protein